MALPLLGALGVRGLLWGLTLGWIGHSALSSDAGRRVLGETLHFTGTALNAILTLPGDALKWIGKKINPAEEDLKKVVGEFMVNLEEAKKEYSLSPERERELIVGIQQYLIENGVKARDVPDFIMEAYRERKGERLDPAEEERVEKRVSAIIDWIDSQNRTVGQSLNR